MTPNLHFDFFFLMEVLHNFFFGRKRITQLQVALEVPIPDDSSLTCQILSLSLSLNFSSLLLERVREVWKWRSIYIPLASPSP